MSPKGTDPKVGRPVRNNPVAKYASRANNRSVAFRDRTSYIRKAKHKGREPWPMGFTQNPSARASASAQWASMV
jgi:hypothetical protein